MNKFWMVLSLALLATQTACSTTRIIRDRDYESSVNAFRSGDPALALKKFPKGEDGGLITSIEKSWLKVWTQNWDPKPLQKQVATFDRRKYTSITREAEYFLTQEAEEGYVPSEHEVVILHLLSAIQFLQTDQREDAEVELRQAGYILDRFWDDASLRLWLAGLWTAAGHWDEAQVDLRRAYQMNPSPALRKLLRGTAPKILNLGFYGVAPVMDWSAGEYTPKFSEEPSQPLAEPIRASTLHWFKRHEKRNTALRDILVKSNFMAQYLGSAAATEAERGINKTVTWSIRAIGVAVGVAVTAAILYALSQGGSSFNGDAAGYLAGGGLVAGTAIWKSGENLDHKLDQSLRAQEKIKQDDLKIYRLVRFLPGWISVNAEESFTGLGSVTSLTAKFSPTQVNLIQHY